MERPTTNVSRTLVGCIAAVLLASAAILTICMDPGASGAAITWRAACTRVGIVMAAFWLALPSKTRPAAWADLNFTSLAAAVLAGLALVRMPFRFILPTAGVVLVLGLLLRPRPRQRPERRVDYADR
jgi:hypothetical protein